MKKLYEINELLFTVIIIVADLLLYLIGQELLWIIGINKSATALIGIFEMIFLYVWIDKNGLKEKYGFCKIADNEQGINRVIYIVPLLLLVILQFTREVSINYSLIDTILFIIVNIRIGFMEELIYRGFLYKALCKYDEGLATVISCVVFGLIHWRGEGMVLLTLIHMIHATTVGFLFCTVFYSGKSLWPCIITHGIYNSCIAFLSKETTMWNYLIISVLKVIISIGFAWYILLKTDSHILEYEKV